MKIVGKPDFEKADEESASIIRLCDYAKDITEFDGKPLARILRNQQAILRSLDLLLAQAECD